MTQVILQYAGERVRNYINGFVSDDQSAVILSTTNVFNIEALDKESCKVIVNLSKVNDIRRLNKFFYAVNKRLENEGLFVCCGETIKQRKRRIRKKYPPGINYLFLLFDLLFRRTTPYLPGIRRIYFALTNGTNRIFSRTEILGRLYSAGFTIVSETFIYPFSYFVVKKVKTPVINENPSYGPLFGMKRIGKGGKFIKTYKFRTMYPFAEYLQEYIYEMNKLTDTGKFKDDFRITRFGKICRKLWLDETPMIYNLIKGDIKLVGVRPLSEQYFGLYPENFRNKRIKYKPGLIPPFYVDLPKTFEEIIASEDKYLQAYDKHPFFTDIKYFFKAMYNILFKKARSS